MAIGQITKLAKHVTKLISLASDQNAASFLSFKRTKISADVTTAAHFMDAQWYSINEFDYAITNKPSSDPETWDWYPAYVEARSKIGRGVLRFPSASYLTSGSMQLKPAMGVTGDGAEATNIRRFPGSTVDGIFTADFLNPGNDYIYLSSLTVDGAWAAGVVGRGIVFNEVHVPSYIQDVTVLNCGGNNIEIKNSSVVNLHRVWSNGSRGGFALDVDTVRSLLVTGGAYEHARNTTAHIRIRNTGNYYYPQVTFTGLHMEGLLENGIVGMELGGGAQYYSVVTVTITGIQVIGKNPTPSGNYCFRLLDANVALAVHGLAQTGTSGFGTGFPAGSTPPDAAQNITYWEYNGNKTSGYSLFTGKLGTLNNEQVTQIKDTVTGAVAAFGVTELAVAIPTQVDAVYYAHTTPQAFMGNNIGVYIDEASKTTTSLKLKFINLTSGAAAQLSNPTKFAVSVKRSV